jgi:large subunit ribosomal protein L33
LTGPTGTLPPLISIVRYAGYAIMAKANTILIKMVSTADTGYYYVTKKNPRTLTDKLEMRKYDPVVRKHVTFKEGRIK